MHTGKQLYTLILRQENCFCKAVICNSHWNLSMAETPYFKNGNTLLESPGFFSFSRKHRDIFNWVKPALTSSTSCLGHHLLFLNEKEFHLESNMQCFPPLWKVICAILKESAGQKKNRKKAQKSLNRTA